MDVDPSPGITVCQGSVLNILNNNTKFRVKNFFLFYASFLIQTWLDMISQTGLMILRRVVLVPALNMSGRTAAHSCFLLEILLPTPGQSGVGTWGVAGV